MLEMLVQLELVVSKNKRYPKLLKHPAVKLSNDTSDVLSKIKSMISLRAVLIHLHFHLN